MIRVPVEIGRRAYAVKGALAITRVRWLNTRDSVAGYDLQRADWIGQVNGLHYVPGPSGSFLISMSPGPLSHTYASMLEVQYEAQEPSQGGLFG